MSATTTSAPDRPSGALPVAKPRARGMSVNAATSLSLTFEGQPFYFCSPHCRDLFGVAPEAFLHPDGVPLAVPDRKAGITGYTCPMHPEVTRNEPGVCPKCGMALEPRTLEFVITPNAPPSSRESFRSVATRIEYPGPARSSQRAPRAIAGTLAAEERRYDVDHDAWRAHSRLTCRASKELARQAVDDVLTPCLFASRGRRARSGLKLRAVATDLLARLLETFVPASVALRVRRAALVAERLHPGVGRRSAGVVDAYRAGRAARRIGEVAPLRAVSRGEVLRRGADSAVARGALRAAASGGRAAARPHARGAGAGARCDGGRHEADDGRCHE